MADDGTVVEQGGDRLLTDKEYRRVDRQRDEKQKQRDVKGMMKGGAEDALLAMAMLLLAERVDMR